jgi:hypothetical protein
MSEFARDKTRPASVVVKPMRAAVHPPCLRLGANDLLFQHVTATDFAITMEFLSVLALNIEYATAEIRSSERERYAHGGPRAARPR